MAELDLLQEWFSFFCFSRSTKVDCQNSWRWQCCHHTAVLPVACTDSADVHPARCCAKAHLGESQRRLADVHLFLAESCTTFFFAEPPFSNAIFFHCQITATPFVQLDFLVGLLVVHLLDIEPGIVPLQGTAQNYILCHSVKRTALFPMIEYSEIRPELDLNAFDVGTM